MLDPIPFDDPRVIGIRIDGRIKSSEYARLLDTLKARLARHDTLRLYVEIRSFGGMSAEAFFKDLAFGLKNWDRFEREAVVTDRKWLHSAAWALDRVFPHTEVKAFAPEEAEQARAWIAE